MEGITECKDLLNIFQQMRLSKNSQGKWIIIYKATKLEDDSWKKGRYLSKKNPTEDTSLWQKSLSSPWNFSEVNFCFRMCHPNYN
jgi:hypothetical protein